MVEVHESLNLREALKEHFGFDTFKGNQEAVIANLLKGNDGFVIMPTGGGKSLCYQLPAMMSGGIAIVISPLIALMKNQVDQLRGFSSNDASAHFLNSSLSKSESQRVKEDVLAGRTKLLYIAPETLSKGDTLDFLKQIKLSFVAVDEAHCISEWGHDFRPEYRRIKDALRLLGDIPVLALTATATPKVQHDIQKNLQMLDATVFKSSFNRPNLYYEVRPKGKKDKVIKDIISYIKTRSGKAGIIYCLSRKKVEEIAEVLNVNGIKALPYHAGLDASTRARHQDSFLMEEVQVIVATIAFGMGIDKPDVRFVIHYDVPKSLESYYQETGRAGRDGLDGECILYYNVSDILKLEKFMKDKPVNEREIGTQLLNETASYCEGSVCRRKMLLHYFGEHFDEQQCNKMCDNCRHPKTKFSILEEMKLVLGLVKSTKGRFDGEELINVLLGVKSQAVSSYELDKTEWFASGKDNDPGFWKAVLRIAQLNDYVSKDIESYGLLSLTPGGEEYLEAPVDIQMALDANFEKVEDEEDNLELENFYDEELFVQLKDLRKKTAKQYNLPPYVIFQEISLEEMAMKYPININELAQITGVGIGKAQRYGKPFADYIAQYVKEREIERPQDVVIKSLVNKSGIKVSIIQNVDKKVPLEDIARSKGISMPELIREVENIVMSGTKLNIKYYINELLDEERQQELMDYFRTAELDDIQTAVKEFSGEYSQEELQLMRVHFLSEMGC